MPLESPDHRITALQKALAGRYEFLSLLGEGGFSNVYSVRNSALGRLEALKVLLHSPGGREAAEFATRFEQEARIVASLDHPNIVKLFDFGSSAGIHWFSMQFIAGASLSDKIDNHAPMPESMAVEILLPVLDALEYAHQRGIVHRDLKPANILFDAEGRPVVTDFGLAKPKGSPSLTRSNVLMGTPHFLAPEQVRGKALDHRSDLYALSVTLYEMLTATTPFSSYDGMEAIVAKLSHDPVPARTLRPDLAVAFDGVLSRGLARNPANRFQSAREMADALRRALERRDEWFVLEEPAGSTEEAFVVETLLEPDEEARPVPSPAGEPALPAESPPAPVDFGQGPTERMTSREEAAPTGRVRRSLGLLGLVFATLLAVAILVLSRRPAEGPVSTSLPQPTRAGPPGVAPVDTRTPEAPAPGAPAPVPSQRAEVPSAPVKPTRDPGVPTARASVPAPVERPATPPVQTSDGDPGTLAGMPEACAGVVVPAVLVVDATGAVTSAKPLGKGSSECWGVAEKSLRSLRFEPARAADGRAVESLPLAVSITLGGPRPP